MDTKDFNENVMLLLARSGFASTLQIVRMATGVKHIAVVKRLNRLKRIGFIKQCGFVTGEKGGGKTIIWMLTDVGAKLISGSSILRYSNIRIVKGLLLSEYVLDNQNGDYPLTFFQKKSIFETRKAWPFKSHGSVSGGTDCLLHIEDDVFHICWPVMSLINFKDKLEDVKETFADSRLKLTLACSEEIYDKLINIIEEVQLVKSKDVNLPDSQKTVEDWKRIFNDLPQNDSRRVIVREHIQKLMGLNSTKESQLKVAKIIKFINIISYKIYPALVNNG